MKGKSGEGWKGRALHTGGEKNTKGFKREKALRFQKDVKRKKNVPLGKGHGGHQRTGLGEIGPDQ